MFLILGAGPAGCAAATVLARAGRDVLLVDALPEPAAAIGESLLPFGTRVLDAMGVDMSGFIVKHGAVFTRGDLNVRFPFAESARRTYTHAWEVPRDDFDARLRKVALEAGARFQLAKARRVDLERKVLVTDEGEIPYDTFVDAAGRRKFLARQLGEIDLHPDLKNAAIHGQFNGVGHPEPSVVGDIAITEFDGGWFWFIPFADGRTSVGLVMTPTSGITGPAESRWTQGLERCAQARRRLADSTRIGRIGGVQDFTSYARRFSGDGWALAGDAAMFLDPVFSSGVLFALETGWTLGEALRDGGDLAAWEQGMRDAARPMELAVLSFYDGTFLDVACAPRGLQKQRFRRAIISLLAGDLFAPGNDVSRRMAEKFQWLAGLLERAPS
ncbi:MAG: NAD(P)-binding protein [Proteobacteria bacterium]|nr:NAD(P)-binding protein [Pseudomonadota bacterium]MCP4915626.1 NAD(P)-binding protein [Pseudomonadota bacterium]